ncbi:hypothetical protein [Streptomyces sp. NPDC059828]|uniref:hypothetical protein n=1 Tax=Streptomyces sp. NPDC059828 TaxID=3346965 RepID=UPI00366298EE
MRLRRGNADEQLAAISAFVPPRATAVATSRSRSPRMPSRARAPRRLSPVSESEVTVVLNCWITEGESTGSPATASRTASKTLAGTPNGARSTSPERRARRALGAGR